MSEQFAPPQNIDRVPDHLMYFQGVPVNPVKEAILIGALDGMNDGFRSSELASERRSEFLEIFQNLGKEKSPEEITEILLEDFLSYRDVLGDRAVKADMSSEHPERARAYAYELAKMISGGQSRELINVLRSIQYDFEQIRAHIPREVTLSPYSESISWVLWDIGKQEALKHWQYNGEFGNYSGSILKERRMIDIVAERQLGWEMHRLAMNGQDMSWLDDILSRYPNEIDLLHKVGDGAHHGQLRSSEYVDLGIYVSSALHTHYNKEGHRENDHLKQN